MKTLGACTLLVLLVFSACHLPVRPIEPASADASRFIPLIDKGIDLSITPMYMGHRQMPRCFLAGAASCLSFVNMVHVAYLVRHPGGKSFLIDTGFSSQVKRDFADLPASNRAALSYTPVAELGELLRKAGNPQIDFVLLTHIHFDHSSGLNDLSRPKVMMPAVEQIYFAHAVTGNPAIMARHFAQADIQTFDFDGPPIENFVQSKDLFRDGSVILVPLPGHTPGSMGILLNQVQGKRLLFVGDAAWSRDAIRIPSHKPSLAAAQVDFDPQQLGDTLARLNALGQAHPDLIIVPAHDGDAYEQVLSLSKRSF